MVHLMLMVKTLRLLSFCKWLDMTYTLQQILWRWYCLCVDGNDDPNDGVMVV